MDNYDEDLTENKWYLTLSQKHEDLYLRATNERWMICIPRIGSWNKSIEDGDLFSQKSFESHILKPVVVYGSESNTDLVHSKNKYTTYNGKEVFIQGSKIICGNGFSYNFNKPSYSKHQEKLDLNVETCHTAQIYFEETFFNENDESYIVLCISEPLEPHLVQQNNKADANNEGVETRPLWEMHGAYLWDRTNHASRLRQQLDEKIAQFVIHPKLVVYMADDTAVNKKIKSMTEDVNNLLTSCLHIILRDNKLKKLSEEPKHKEAIKTALEGYVLHGIHKTLINELNNVLALQDCAFNRIARNLQTITLNDLGIQEQFWSSVPRARRALSKINRCRTAKEKMLCLHNAVLCLSSKPKDQCDFPGESLGSPMEENTFGENSVAMQKRPSGMAALSTDDFLPILVYLVIKCDVPNWISNFTYLKYFDFTKTAQDKSWFYLTTLEAALEHVKHENLHVTNICSFKKQHSYEELEDFYLLLKNGETDAVKRKLKQAEIRRNLQEHDKCHPLCECCKCKMQQDNKPQSASHQDISVLSRDDKGRTPLHIAAITGKHEMVEVLIKFGADLNSSDYHESTPLHLAAQEGNQSVIFILLFHGANANAIDNNNNTALHLACLGGHDSCVKALLYYDPASTIVKVNAANDVGDTPLHIASKWGFISIVKSLIEYGADPHQTNKRKVTPYNVSHNASISQALKNTPAETCHLVTHIHQETSTQNNHKMKSFSKKNGRASLKASLPKPPSDEETMQRQVEKLLRSVIDNDVQMVSFVCGWNVKPNNTSEKCHPLCQCFKCQPPVQDICLHANVSDIDGMTPLIIASKLGFVGMVELLLDHDANVNAKNKTKSHTPLHFAAQYGHDKIVKLLLDKRAAYDARDSEGNTPMFMCAMNGHLHCVSMLMQFGASINIRNHRGDSPLHEAVRWKHNATAFLLISHGALAYYKNNKGQTALDLSRQDSELHDSLQQALESGDVSDDDDIFNAEPTSPVHLAKNSPCRASLSLSEADERLAEELLEQFQADSVPSTPPMVDAAVIGSDVDDLGFENVDAFASTLRERLEPTEWSSDAEDSTLLIIGNTKVPNDDAVNRASSNNHSTSSASINDPAPSNPNDNHPASLNDERQTMSSSLPGTCDEELTRASLDKRSSSLESGSADSVKSGKDDSYFQVLPKLSKKSSASAETQPTLDAEPATSSGEAPALVESEHLQKAASDDYLSLHQKVLNDQL